MSLNPLFDADKTELLALVKLHQCKDMRLVEKVNSYPGLYNLLDLQIETFKCEPQYLVDVLQLFDNALLLSYGIYLNQSGTITNPSFVVKGTYTDIILDNISSSLYIQSGVIANRIIVRNNSNIDYLLVAGGSKITELVIEEGSKVQFLSIQNCGTQETSVGNVNAGCIITGLYSTFIEPKREVVEPEPNNSVGRSAYEVWLDNGNTGTEQDYLLSLKGSTGATGPQGPPGNSSGGQVSNEIPSGAKDRVNTTFTTANSFVTDSTNVFINGVKQTLNLAYNEQNGNQIVFTDNVGLWPTAQLTINYSISTTI